MFDNQFNGRKQITTHRKLTGNSQKDIGIIKEIIEESLPIHLDNCAKIKELFRIYLNDEDYWDKTKSQRNDINNKVTVDDAWAISRTINGYCFGEPIKYVARKTDAESGIQEKVELLSQMLDYQHNHDSTIMATLCSSICGVGYKLALPSTKEEYQFSGVPFSINPDFIDPTQAFCVYSNDIMHEKLLGVMFGIYRTEDDEEKVQYTVWTKYHMYYLIDDNGEFKELPFVVNGDVINAYPTFINRIPLIEIDRNGFRKGDWEVITDLFKLKNKLQSDRIDDIDQIVDYIMVLTNCTFDSEEDKKSALTSRVIELIQKDPKNAPSVSILQNPLQQDGVQVFADYIDSLIETISGIPNRAERGGGGHDTGAAVVYRNGFRDLENNAGLIIPKMDKAETEFLGICIAYSHSMTDDKLAGLTPFDVRNKFVRSMSDDPSTSSTAYATFRNAGMNDLDALIASRAVTDPSEVHKNNKNAKAEEEKENQMLNNFEQNDKVIDKE